MTTTPGSSPRARACGRSSRAAATQPPVTPLVPGDATTQDTLLYLHSNCGTCHHDDSPMIDRTPLRLRLLSEQLATVETTSAYLSTVNVSPVLPMAEASVLVAPGQPGSSALLARMQTRGTGAMPPLASEMTDDDGVALVGRWVAGLVDGPVLHSEVSVDALVGSCQNDGFWCNLQGVCGQFDEVQHEFDGNQHACKFMQDGNELRRHLVDATEACLVVNGAIETRGVPGTNPIQCMSDPLPPGWYVASEITPDALVAACRDDRHWCTQAGVCDEFDGVQHEFSGRHWCKFTSGGQVQSRYAIDATEACRRITGAADAIGKVNTNPIDCLRPQ